MQYKFIWNPPTSKLVSLIHIRYVLVLHFINTFTHFTYICVYVIIFNTPKHTRLNNIKTNSYYI